MGLSRGVCFNPPIQSTSDTGRVMGGEESKSVMNDKNLLFGGSSDAGHGRSSLSSSRKGQRGEDGKYANAQEGV